MWHALLPQKRWLWVRGGKAPAGKGSDHPPVQPGSSIELGSRSCGGITRLRMGVEKGLKARRGSPESGLEGSDRSGAFRDEDPSQESLWLQAAASFRADEAFLRGVLLLLVLFLFLLGPATACVTHRRPPIESWPICLYPRIRGNQGMWVFFGSVGRGWGGVRAATAAPRRGG